MTAITQPSDQMSMASENGRPNIISGALNEDEMKKIVIELNKVRSMQPWIKVLIFQNNHFTTCNMVIGGFCPAWREIWKSPSQSQSVSPGTAVSRDPPSWCFLVSHQYGSRQSSSGHQMLWLTVKNNNNYSNVIIKCIYGNLNSKLQCFNQTVK